MLFGGQWRRRRTLSFVHCSCDQLGNKRGRSFLERHNTECTWKISSLPSKLSKSHSKEPSALWFTDLHFLTGQFCPCTLSFRVQFALFSSSYFGGLRGRNYARVFFSAIPLCFVFLAPRPPPPVLTRVFFCVHQMPLTCTDNNGPPPPSYDKLNPQSTR